MMRIITGRARGAKLIAPKGENTRPTAERTKEAVFSMLQFSIAGKQVLDLFAGSGQMALEALSRGAEHAVLADASRDAVDVIRSNALKTKLIPQCEILCMDYSAVLNQMRRRQFDLVFLDPPYAMHAIPQILQSMIQYGMLSPDAVLVCEAGAFEDVFGDAKEILCPHFEILRTNRYGVAYVTILQYKAETQNRKESTI